MENGVAKAIRIAGGQSALGNMLGISQQAVRKWLEKGVAPSQRCRDIENSLDGQVTRYELNPKVFGDRPPNFPTLP